MNNRKEIIDKIRDIPAIPAITSKTLKILRDPDSDIKEAVKLFELDPGITANILKLVNSSVFSGEIKIYSIRDALVRLGGRRITQMLLSSSVSKFMNRPLAGYELSAGELWHSAVSCALSMETIAKLLNIKLPEHAFTAGIMHDIGKILLGSFIDVKSELIISYAENENISFPEAEQEILGIDHAEAGAILIEKWELPEEFYKPLRLHHKPEEAEGDMVTELVHLADVLTLMEGIGTGRDGLRYKVSNKTAEKYQLTPSLIERTICETKVRYDEVKGLLG